MAREGIGSAFVSVGLNIADFREAVANELPKESKRAGQMSAAELLKAVKAEFVRQRNATKEALAKGLITKEEARRLGQESGRALNRALLPELDRLRRSGQENTAEFQQLQRALRQVGSSGTASLRPVEAGFKRLITSTRLWVAGLTTGAVLLFRRMVRATMGDLAAFDAALTESLAIMGEVPAHLRTQMAETARAVSKDLNLSAEQAGRAFFYLASAGLDAEQSIAAFPQVAAFAKAGMFDLARATDLATDAQSALGLTVDDAQQNLVNMARVTDVLVKANTLANASVEQFSTALTNRAGTAAKIVGKDIEEVVAVLAAFADQGTKSEEAGTRVDIVMRDLQRRAIENREEFARFNIAVFDSQGTMRNMADIIGDIERAFVGMSNEEQRATIMTLGFADRSVSALLQLVGLSARIREYEAELRKAGGTTQRVADNQLRAISERFALVRQQLADAGREVARLVILPLAEWFAGIAGALANTDTPLERTISLLKGVNAEASALLQNRQAIVLLREEIAKLERQQLSVETGRVSGAALGAPVAPRGLSAELGPLSDVALAQQRRDERRRLLEAVAEADDREAQLRKRNLDAIEAEITRRTDLRAAVEALADAEAERLRLVERFELSAEVEALDAQIEALGQAGLAMNDYVRQLAALQQQRAQLAGVLAGPTPTGGAAEEGEEGRAADEEAAAEAAEKAARAAESLTRALAQLNAERKVAAELGVAEVPAELTAKLKEVIDLEQRLGELRRLRREAGAAAPAGTDETIAAEEARLERLRVSFNELADDMKAKLVAVPEAIVQSVASVGPALLRSVEPVLTSLNDEVQLVLAAQEELDQALRTGDRDRAERARRTLQEQRDALREAAAAAAAGLERAGLPAKQLRDLMKEVDATLRAAGIDVDALTDGFEDAARGIELLGRGVLGVLDSLGAVDNEVRRVLTGVLDLAAGLTQLGSASGVLATLGGVGAVAGAVVGIGSALFGGGGEEERQRREAQRRQREEVERLTVALRDLGDSMGPLTQSIQEAREALAELSKATGRPEDPEELRALRDVKVATRESLASALAEERDPEEAKRLAAEIAYLDAQIKALNRTLADYDAAVAKVRAGLLQDLELARLRAEGTTKELELRELEIAQSARRRDVEESGLATDREVLEALEAAEEAERRALEARVAAREATWQREAEVQQLQAAGLTRTARLTEQLAEQERRLAALRQEGADAATLAAQEEANLATNRAEAAALETSLRRRMAERSGDDEALRELDAADLRTRAADDIAALEKLFGAGFIDEETLASLVALVGEDLAAALDELAASAEDAAAAAKEAADSFREDLREDLLEAGGDTEGLRRLRADQKRRDRIERAKELGLYDEVADDIERLYRSDLGEGEAAAARAAGSAALGPTEVAKGLTSASETSVLNLTSFARSSWEELKLVRAASQDAARSLRALAARFEPTVAAQPQRLPSSTSTSAVVGALTLRVELPNVREFAPTEARAAANEIVRIVNLELGRRWESQYRGAGGATR